ncbi:MAG: dipeptidase [Pseudomonadota bacterium]
MSDLDAVLARIDADLDSSLERLNQLLRIPSVSTEAAHVADCRHAAEWLAADLKAIGFDAAVRDTEGHPMVVGHDHQTRGPRALFYGHYDVQPVDPLNLWDHSPFEPQIETRPDGTKMIRARGSSDDKGQLMTFVEACRAWKAVTGSLPIPVTIFLEGEEEAGGRSMAPFLDANREELTADIALVCDTTMWNAETPAITYSLRGMAAGEITIRAADRDLHSGHYGSAARNPIALLATILADMRDAAGKVTLPGFYDGVPETPAEIRAMWDALGFQPSEFLGDIGLSQPAGEADRSVLEQTWARPTAEINGFIGGYTGDGFKTVIPAEASAKISFRLVGDQDPDAIWAAFEEFVRARLPADCEADIKAHHGAQAISLPLDSPMLRKAAAALSREWDREAAIIGAGGSIPVVGEFKRRLGMDTLLVGFALESDNIHSPNEKYELRSFHKGIRSWARILASLAE